MDHSLLTYDMRRAAEVLGCSYSWLRDQVTAGTVPHGRWGSRKGVFFMSEHLAEILASRQLAARARPSAVRPAASTVRVVEVPTEFAGLRSARGRKASGR
jgi:hypothetical protein